MSQGVPSHAGRARKRVAACKDGCLLVVFSRGVHVPTTPVTVGRALHGHQGTHVQVPALKTLIQPPRGLVCAMLSHLQALCPLLPFCLSFIFPLLFVAVLMNISWPGTSVNSPGCSLPPSWLGCVCQEAEMASLGREGSNGSDVGSCVVSPSPAVLSLSLQPARDGQRTVVAACPCTDGLHGSRASLHTLARPCPGGPGGPGGHACLRAPAQLHVSPPVPRVPSAATAV